MKVDYITLRDVGNAGDNLIGYTLQHFIRKYWGPKVDFNVCHIQKDEYEDKCRNRNILFGPGGIVTGSADPADPDSLFLKGITGELLNKWRDENKRIVFFGSGTNSSTEYRPFTAQSGKLLGDLAAISRVLFLRGSKDIEIVGQMVERRHRYKLRFQPCPSLFLDHIYGIPAHQTDRVAINWNFGAMTREEALAHPLNRFVDYVKSEGLTPVLFANHPVDVNEALADKFDGHFVYNSPRYNADGVRKMEEANKNLTIKNSLHQDRDLAADFNGYRFAVGKRLHAFLPFAAFGSVPVFLSTRPMRRTMPAEYFGEEDLSFPFNKNAPDEAVDNLIARFRTVVKREKGLRQKIKERKKTLLSRSIDNLYEVQDIFAG